MGGYTKSGLDRSLIGEIRQKAKGRKVRENLEKYLFITEFSIKVK